MSLFKLVTVIYILLFITCLAYSIYKCYGHQILATNFVDYQRLSIEIREGRNIVQIRAHNVGLCISG
jgi:hypothetical protein